MNKMVVLICMVLGVQASFAQELKDNDSIAEDSVKNILQGLIDITGD